MPPAVATSKQDRVHYLNQPARVILELCNGQATEFVQNSLKRG
jgi:hypothetical protein